MVKSSWASKLEKLLGALGGLLLPLTMGVNLANGSHIGAHTLVRGWEDPIFFSKNQAPSFLNVETYETESARE